MLNKLVYLNLIVPDIKEIHGIIFDQSSNYLENLLSAGMSHNVTSQKPVLSTLVSHALCLCE